MTISDDQHGTERSATRYALTLVLVLGATVTAAVLAFDHRLDPPGWRPLAALALLVAALCWRWRSTRLLTRWILAIAVVVLGWPLLHLHDPVTDDLDGVDDALLGAGAISAWRCAAALLTLAAFVASCGRVRRGRPPLRSGLVALLAVAVIAAALVPAARGLRTITEHRMIGRVEQSSRPDEPELSGAHDLRIGSRDGWRRSGVEDAVPVGDRLIAVASSDQHQSDTVAAYRAADGARLWSYRVKAHGDGYSVDEVTVDPAGRRLMVRVGRALIGLDLDGHVRYRHRVPLDDDPHEWSTVSDQGAAESLETGTVSVLTDGYAVSAVSVATGEVRWHYVAEQGRCQMSQATSGRDSYLLLTGSTDCHSLVVFDGARKVRETPLASAAQIDDADGLPRWFPTSDPYGGDPTVHAVAVPDDGRVAVSTFWDDDSASVHLDRERLAHYGWRVQLFDRHGAPKGALRLPVTRHLITRPLGPVVAVGAGVGLPVDATTEPELSWLATRAGATDPRTSRVERGRPYDVARVGDVLVSSRLGGGSVRLFTIGRTLTGGETIERSALPGCDDHIDASGDATRLILRCGSSIYVRAGA